MTPPASTPSTAQHIVFAIPGDLDTPTGGYVYDRRVIQELRERGVDVTHLEWGSSFPHPSAHDTAEAIAQLSAIDDLRVVLIDGLALGALEPAPFAAALAVTNTPVVALIHHPLALEGHLDDARRDELFRIERENLARCARVITTSAATAKVLVDEYAVPTSQITVARPGTDRPHYETLPGSPPLIVSVGSQSPRKGHDVLLRALGEITSLPWQAVICGSARDEAHSLALHRLMEELGLAQRVRVEGELSTTELHELYSRASVFALATRFEGYGMVFDEAMAFGLPIVSCAVGAVPDTVAPGAGILVPADDPEAFAAALGRVLTDEDQRRAMATASHQAGLALPRWSDTARIIAGVLDEAQRERMGW
jgi:glycosyltransferase involved in cell wall biosynthesis